jgi:hypothetical protein
MRVIILTISLLVAALPARGGAQEPAQPKAPQGPSSAPTSRPGAEPPAAARELARALLPQERWDRLLDSYASSLSAQVSQALLSRGEPVPDGLQAKLRSELGDRLQYQQTIDAQAKALASEFTHDELKKTAAFYSTPAGKKMLEKLPEAQEAVGQELQARLNTAVPEILQRIAPKALAAPDSAQSSGEAEKEPPAAQGRRPPEPKGR